MVQQRIVHRAPSFADEPPRGGHAGVPLTFAVFKNIVETRNMRPTPSSLQHEIGKRRPFESPAQEAYLNMVRTASLLGTDFNRLFKRHGLSEGTFNVLRILRGALAGDTAAKVKPAAAGLRACNEIVRDLVAVVPDLTRLIDRLEKQGFVARSRCGDDRRVVHVKITPKGLDAVGALDAPTLELHQAQLAHMTSIELQELSRLLAKAREKATIGLRDAHAAREAAAAAHQRTKPDTQR
jgi:DNA-binding MarR family transcriptional regulator